MVGLPKRSVQPPSGHSRSHPSSREVCDLPVLSRLGVASLVPSISSRVWQEAPRSGEAGAPSDEQEPEGTGVRAQPRAKRCFLYAASDHVAEQQLKRGQRRPEGGKRQGEGSHDGEGAIKRRKAIGPFLLQAHTQTASGSRQLPLQSEMTEASGLLCSRRCASA